MFNPEFTQEDTQIVGNPKLEEETPNEQLNIIFYYGAYPLWKFLNIKFSIDIRDVCAQVSKYDPTLFVSNGKYNTLIVDNNYQNNLDETHNEHITFLLNCINSVFNMLKEGIIKNGEHILRPYYFQLDEYKNLELLLVKDENINEETYVKSNNDNIKIGIAFLK